MVDNKTRDTFLAILEDELIPAMGCTEPISLSYAAARGASVLGTVPDKIIARCSGNIIKNVRCVRIPNSGGLTGIEAACALGAIAGDHTRHMEVLEAVTPEGLERAKSFLQGGGCTVELLSSPYSLHFIIELIHGTDTVSVEVRHDHTGIVSIEKNGSEVYRNDSVGTPVCGQDRSLLSVERILEFANDVEIERIISFVNKQIKCNMAIAECGMKGEYGVGIGQAILEMYPESPFTKARAYAAAASEARMDGCDMPVIITSGSGNQGITSSVPVIVYARECGVCTEKMYRALVFSSLLTVYQKEYIGKLSAFCGAVSAACSAGAAITYMAGGGLQEINATINNTLANTPGIICDGAKASCAAKISSALDAAMFAHTLAMKGRSYESNTGILQDNTGETISCVGHIGRVGMQPTDEEIVKLMITPDKEDKK